MSRFRHLFSFAVLVAASAALAAGCGSSGSSGPTGGAASGPSNQPASHTLGSPINIGYINDESGPVAVP